MKFAGQAALPYDVVGGYDRRITLGYVVFAILAVCAVYFASGGPGMLLRRRCLSLQARFEG